MPTRTSDSAVRRFRPGAWTWLIAYLLGIYASLPIMPVAWRTLDKGLHGNGVSVIYGATGLFFLGLLIVLDWQGRLTLPRFGASLLCIGAILGLGSLEQNPGEKVHMVLYAGLGLLLFKTIGQRGHPSSSTITLWAGLLCFAAGGIDELIQLGLSNRTFTWHDILVNGASSLLTFWIMLVCRTVPARQVYQIS
jgi:hypothetical protein